MLGKMKTYILSLCSKETAACKNRYNNKCSEVRTLLEKIESLQRETASNRKLDAILQSKLDASNRELAAKDLEIEKLNNQITLTDLVVEQQLQIIKRDLEMRRLEHVDASVRTQLASAMGGHKAKEGSQNVTDESDINFRPGR